MLLTGVTLSLILACVLGMPRPPVLALPACVAPRDRSLATEAFEVKYGRSPDRLDLLSFLAELYLARNRLDDAIACFDEIPTTHPEYGAMARFQQGRTLLTLHRAAGAERQFRTLIAAEETAPRLPTRYLLDARQRLRHILEVELRFEERQPLVTLLVQRGEADHFETVVSCFPSHLRWNGDDAVRWLEEFHAADPDDRLIRIALGRYRTGQGRLDEARTLLEGVMQQFPHDLWATACLIACLREADDGAAADRLIESLPPLASSDPWLLMLRRGAHALEHGQLEAAQAAYDMLLAADRTNTEAWQKLAMIARLRGDEPQRVRAVTVAAGLSRIQNHIGKGIQRPEDPNSFLDVADVCFEIGFDLEGWILTRFARRLAPEFPRTLRLLELHPEPTAAAAPAEDS